jgi:STE24 endopeptidase
MDGSKRSTKSNAFFTGFGKNKRIALYDTFINKHTVPEIVAVLAHEIGHYKKKHILQGMVIGIVHTGVLLFLLSIFLRAQGLYDAFLMEHQSIYAGFLFFGLLYTPIEMLLSIGMNTLSRKNEYEADKYAATTVEQPQVMIDALKKLSSHNLSNLTPHPFYAFMHYSHPALLQRIRAIKRYLA